MSDSSKEIGAGNETAKRILIVDDDVDSSEVLQILLHLEGHQVRMASDQRDVLRTVSAFLPEVILFYVRMQGIDLAEFIKNISLSLPDTLLVAMLDWTDAKDANRWTEMGFHGHLVKPVRAEDVIALLNSRGQV